MNDNTYRNEQMTEENILEKDLNESQDQNGRKFKRTKFIKRN